MSREPCFFRSLHVSDPQGTPNRVYLEPRQHTDGRELPGLSKDWPLLCCPGFTLFVLFGAVNEFASSVGEISVPLAFPRSGGRLLVRAGWLQEQGCRHFSCSRYLFIVNWINTPGWHEYVR
ncbi:hypothetical protein E2C01_079350 [Portunus trituberculatus]|uniref:Uncharacterized protein n=1 Tax=Portunus trituberculatus TaxID=210409 RepID=A0A5B7ISI5_PORTR|nr:hypothetical protein [Portunus trituberculatus]